MTNLVSFINAFDYHSSERTCVVFGCGRGGTSALAGGLRELGFTMPQAHPLKHEWSPIAESNSGSLTNLKEKISSLNKLYSRWGWKSPKDVFIALDYLPLLRNPLVFIIVRNPLDVALSMSKYDGIDVEVAFDESIKAYNGVAKLVSNTYYPCALISYENLLMKPYEIFEIINENYSLGCTSDEIKRSGLFIEKSKGYNTVSSEQRDLKFNVEELSADRRNAQDRVYPPLISHFAQATALIENDIQLAKSNLTHHIDELFKLTRERNRFLNSAIDENVLYQLYSVDRCEFSKLLGLDSVVALDEVSINVSHHIGGHSKVEFKEAQDEDGISEENLSYRIYLLTKNKFFAARKERQRIQYEIEEIILRQNILIDFLKQS